MGAEVELSQGSLFADEAESGIEVIYSKFIDRRRTDYKTLFGGFDHLRVITFSYGLGFVETVADMFEDVEIIIGSKDTVRPDIVDVAGYQLKWMRHLSKRGRLVERVEGGSVRIYFNMRKMSHEKLYILSADDGRCRVITGSANLSKRAFTGGQYEEITCFDGDTAMYENRLARYEALRAMASITPLEPAAMVDFMSADGDGAAELASVPVFRTKGVVYLCDMPEDDETDTFYTFDPKDMTDEEREMFVAMGERKVDYTKVNGGRVVMPDEVKRIIATARDAVVRHKVTAAAYPKFHYDTETGIAMLNDREYAVPQEGAWIADAHRIADLMRGFDMFVGDADMTRRQLFKVLSFMFASTFISRMRDAAVRMGYAMELFPMYCVLYGDSNAGKSTFTQMCHQLMYGSTEIGRIPHDKWTKTGIAHINGMCPEMSLVIDDMIWDKFKKYAEAIIKDDWFAGHGDGAQTPIYTLTVNKMGALSPQLAKRCIPIRTDVRLDRETGIRMRKSVSDAMGKLTTAFYLEYLNRMAPRVTAMLDEVARGDLDYQPDLLHASSAVLDEMMGEAVGDDDWHRPLTIDDFIGDGETSRIARDKLLEAWRIDPNQFKVRPNGQGVEFRPDGSDVDWALRFEVKAIHDELPASLNATLAGSVIVFRDTAALESFLGVRLDKSIGASLRRLLTGMRQGV